MIPAIEALALGTAQLTDEEVELANKLEATISEHVRENMRRNGCELETKETNPIVIAEVDYRLKVAGYVPEWRQFIKQHPLNKAINQCVGFGLFLAPSFDAVKAARERIMHFIDS